MLPASLLALLLAALLSSCGPSARRADKVPLSDVLFRLRNGGLAGAIPQGWTATGPAGAAGSGGAVDSLAAMTLSGGDSLRIVFRQVTLDSSAAAYFRNRGVTDLAMLTRTLHDSTIGIVRDGIGKFKAGGREFASYEVRVDGRKMNVVVFGSGGYWYECEAAGAKPLAEPRSYDALIATQLAVLRSLR